MPSNWSDRTELKGKAMQALTALACLIIIAIVAIIIGNIVTYGAGKLSWEFLSEPPREHFTKGGIFPAIFGTAALVILMTIAVIPLGVATAIYMHEYAPKRSRLVHFVRLAIQNLAGVPAIVFGLFGVGFFIEFVGRGIDQRFVRRQIGLRPAGDHLVGFDDGLADTSDGGRSHGRGAAGNSRQLSGGRLFSRRNALANDMAGCSPAIGRRNSYRRNSCRKPRIGRSGPGHVHGRSLFTARSSGPASQSIHGARIPRVRDEHAGL